MTNNMYLIESGAVDSPVSLEGFVPRRKVALLIQGSGKPHGASFDMTVDLLVQRGYDYITAVRNSVGNPFCSDVVPFYKKNVQGKINDLVNTLTPEDILFTAIFGASEIENGSVYMSDRLGQRIQGCELRDSFSAVAAHHIIHYASLDAQAGELARVLSCATHPELGTRHIGIAPTVPSVPYSLFPYRKDAHSPELVHPFHAAFFDLANQPTLLDRFRNAAAYHRGHVDAHRYGQTQVYMRHASVQPAEVACTR